MVGGGIREGGGDVFFSGVGVGFGLLDLDGMGRAMIPGMRNTARFIGARCIYEM